MSEFFIYAAKLDFILELSYFVDTNHLVDLQIWQLFPPNAEDMLAGCEDSWVTGVAWWLQCRGRPAVAGCSSEWVSDYPEEMGELLWRGRRRLQLLLCTDWQTDRQTRGSQSLTTAAFSWFVFHGRYVLCLKRTDSLISVRVIISVRDCLIFVPFQFLRQTLSVYQRVYAVRQFSFYHSRGHIQILISDVRIKPRNVNKSFKFRRVSVNKCWCVWESFRNMMTFLCVFYFAVWAAILSASTSIYLFRF
jgi:hypothetical protein